MMWLVLRRLKSRSLTKVTAQKAVVKAVPLRTTKGSRMVFWRSSAEGISIGAIVLRRGLPGSAFAGCKVDSGQCQG